MTTNILTLLKQDHDEVREIFEELTETTSRGAKKRTELFARVKEMIIAHSKAEEAVFYPAYREAVKKNEEQKLFFEAKEEHQVVDFVIEGFASLDPATPEFSAKVKVLKELVE